MSCHCDMHGRGNASHCRACCITFSGVSAFDRHLLRGVHQPPASRGLTEVRPGVWGWPQSGRSRFGVSPQTAERDGVKAITLAARPGPQNPAARVFLPGWPEALQGA